MAEGKRCPECKSVIPIDATVCRYCCQRIEGIKCPECASLSKADAKICICCGKKLLKKKSVKFTSPLEIKSSFWGTMLTRFSFFPQESIFSNDKLLVKTFGFLALTSHEEDIPWEKVAGFQHKDGIFWDTIWIETRGQSSACITALKKNESIRVKTILQRLEK